MLRLLITVSLVMACCLAQEDFHLKIAEKLAIPHHIRHAFDYPAINFNAMLANRRVPQNPAAQAAPQQSFNREPLRPAPVRQSIGFNSQPSGFQPSGFSAPSRGFSAQPSPAGPGRQTRFFNLYTPNSRPFGFERRDS